MTIDFYFDKTDEYQLIRNLCSFCGCMSSDICKDIYLLLEKISQKKETFAIVKYAKELKMNIKYLELLIHCLPCDLIDHASTRRFNYIPYPETFDLVWILIKENKQKKLTEDRLEKVLIDYRAKDYYPILTQMIYGFKK